MAGQPITFVVDAATFAGLSADDYPDGQHVRVSDTGVTWEASGADGGRSWVEASINSDAVEAAGRWEVLLDIDSQPVDNGAGDWLYVWTEE